MSDDKNCDNCKHKDVGADELPCGSCFGGIKSQWQPVDVELELSKDTMRVFLGILNEDSFLDFAQGPQLDILAKLIDLKRCPESDVDFRARIKAELND